MPTLRAFAPILAIAAGLTGLTTAPAAAQELRVATYNTSLYRDAAGALAAELGGGGSAAAQDVATIIRAADPDILLINEFDYAPGTLDLFVDTYLAGAGYDYRFAAPSNTGTASGQDLNNDGQTVTTPGSFDYANDAFGFGQFPGQYGMAVISRHPIDTDAIRTFQTFLWADMPGARVPAVPDGTPYYNAEAWAVFRLSSKSHWDIPVTVGDQVIHLLASHPTPPVFDGPEDRNGRRNADEIRFWADYVQGADYIYDDVGGTGGLPEGAHFVIAGDLNADPADGDSTDNAILQVLDLPLVNTSLTPASPGAPEAAAAQGGANDAHTGDPAFDTADFGDDPDRGSGNLRADYVLPSATLTLTDAAVVWPRADDPLAAAARVSDHFLVWVDVSIPE